MESAEVNGTSEVIPGSACLAVDSCWSTATCRSCDVINVVSTLAERTHLGCAVDRLDGCEYFPRCVGACLVQSSSENLRLQRLDMCVSDDSFIRYSCLSLCRYSKERFLSIPQTEQEEVLIPLGTRSSLNRIKQITHDVFSTFPLQCLTNDS